ALGVGPGAELQAPLAIAVLGGLLSATALTLLVIPVAYDLLEEMGERARVLFGAREPEVHVVPGLVTGD
ncbi:MAG: efflux RND transporter permease subunit, partial [Gemmatimonadota bacterium]|nr:efflux RND transporter permease subunit [Gemmatimonadota bacterium]